MIVFISSVRRGLEAERDYLPALLRAAGHQPRRFEDFTAQPSPSRDACLTGVEQAEVYLLLLGQHYGQPMADTGAAPTEEEFTVAKRRGIPILVFRKSGVEPDDRQTDFIARVGEYQRGRLWKQFDGPLDLGVLVLAALAEASTTTPLSWEPVAQPPTIRWRADRSWPPRHTNTFAAVLEVHLVPPDARPVMPVAALEPRSRRLGRVGREAGLFPESAGLKIGSNAEEAWTWCEVDDRRASRGPSNKVWRDGASGLVVDRAGGVMVFETLPRDQMGTLVDQPYLGERLTMLIRTAHAILAAEVMHLVPVAGLAPIDWVQEGDPAKLGSRMSSSMRTGQTQPVHTQPDSQIEVGALPAAIPEVARELAARLTAELRSRRF